MRDGSVVSEIHTSSSCWASRGAGSAAGCDLNRAAAVAHGTTPAVACRYRGNEASSAATGRRWNASESACPPPHPASRGPRAAAASPAPSFS